MNWRNLTIVLNPTRSRGLLGLVLFCFAQMAAANESLAVKAAERLTNEQATASIGKQIRNQLRKSAIDRWPNADVTVQLTLVAERLNLSQCNDLTITPRGNRIYGRVPVSLRCTLPVPWQLFVQAQVEVELPVVTVMTSLPRGQKLKASDLAYAPRKLSTLRPQFITDLSRAVGYISSRALNVESVLYSNAIKQPVTIPKGQRVAIAGGRGAIQIAAQGEALEAGMHGDQIKVRNVQSGRELFAWVVGPGQVARHWPNPET